MKNLRTYLVNFLLVLLFLSLPLRAEEEAPFRVKRLSDKVLVLTEISPMENIIVALASEKGLVVVDSTGSHYTASLMRKLIEKEFGRKDWAYLIDTHHHWDHAWGNQVFADTMIIGHELCDDYLRRDTAEINRVEESFKGNLDRLKSGLEGLDKNSKEAGVLKEQYAFASRNYKGLSEGFVPTPPSMTFSDQMKMDLGDLTLKLYYFGRAHSGCDIFIHVPEEGILLTGDLFLERGWLPLFSGQNELDIPRWIDVLHTVLDGGDPVKYVIPGHRDIWEKEKLVMWRDYIVNLWEGLKAAEAEGMDLRTSLERFPLDKKFDYLKELNHDEAELRRFQQGNIIAFWRQLQESAALEVERTMTESGIEAALAKYQELKSLPRGEYFFDEGSFNALGYRLMGQRKLKEAIAVFKLNVDAYPNSWNVYDSLAEAYMNNGQAGLAIKNYQKSLELNPQNNNAKEILKRLKK